MNLYLDGTKIEEYSKCSSIDRTEYQIYQADSYELDVFTEGDRSFEDLMAFTTAKSSDYRKMKLQQQQQHV